MSKHGAHVKDPTFKKRFRAKAYFSVNPVTGFPKNDHRVEQYIDGQWLAVPELEPYDTREKAQVEADPRELGWAQ